MKKEKLKRIAKRITALAAAVAMAATFTFPAEIGDGFFDGFGNAIVASAVATQLNVADGDVNITAPGDYEITGSSTGAKITVNCTGTVNIKFVGLNLGWGNPPGARFVINNGTVNLELDGDNLLQAHQNVAPHPCVQMSDNAELHIYDSDGNGSIKIHGSSNYDGGGDAVSGGSLFIHGGNVSLIGGNKVNGTYGKSFAGKKLEIEGGSLSFSSGDINNTQNGNITVSDSFKVGLGVSLTVPTNGTIEIGTGASATVDGTIINKGTITNNGTLTNNGSIINFGSGSVTGTVSGNQPDTKGTAFTITGSGLVYGTDYTYPASTGVLTIKSDKAITIANANPTATTDRIEVEQNKDANITLAGVNIDVSNTGSYYPAVVGDAAFRIEDSSTGNVTITLADETTNILKGGNYCAALQKNGTYISATKGKLTIQGGTNGTGELTATGGYHGAGIGGGDYGHGSNITISGGIITAAGGGYGAGIGGGNYGKGSNITINGGTVTATGGDSGAGIGGGLWRSASNITISGGTVNANAGINGTGIGGGAHSSGSYITIDGGTVTAIGNKGAGVGGGMSGDFGSYITINGGTVTATSTDGAGIGGGLDGNSSNILITGGSVKAISTNANAIGGGLNKNAVTPTLADSTTNVYLLTVKNQNSEVVTIGGNSYIPVNHKALDSNDGNLYAYLPAKTSTDDPLVVEVGTKTTNYIYDTTKSAWLAIVDKPAEDNRPFTYDGTEQTYNIAASDYYTVKDNKQTNAGTYTVTVALTDTTKTVWSDGTIDDLTYTFKINKKPATVTPPTAPTAISYGKTLADTGLTAGWTWKDGSTYIPKVSETTSSAFKIVDDYDNYDYNGLSLSGFTYDEENNKLSYNVPITVNPATPKITVTANPSSAITGKETTVTVTAEVKNPNNDLLNDCHPAELSYKIGNGSEQAITGGTFVIPANTPNGTTFTIIARTSATANYNAGTGTSTVVVSNCTHPNKPAAWKNDATHHWHKCPDCGAELDKAEHSSNAAATETSPEVCKDCEYVMTSALGHIHANHLTFVAEVPETCTTDGVNAHYECDCGKLFADDQASTEVTADDLKIPAHHSYGTKWVSDNDENHYHLCSVCGDKTDITAHSYDSGVITTSATEQTTGIKTYTCSECNHKKTETVPVLDHTHSLATDYSSDATGHWYACSGCTEKVDFEAHTEDNGTVTKNPTETTEGVKTFKCTKCEYVIRTETIAVLDHTHVPTDEYSKDETGHWHTCTGCDEKLDFAAHTYGKWKITVPATVQANGKKERICSVCGYVQEGTVIYGGDDSTGDIDNATNPEDNALHAELELTDEEIINKIPLTPEELEAIENGADLTVYMVVIDYSGNVPAEDKTLAESVLTDGMKIGMYIDISLYKKVGDNAPKPVNQTNGDLKITFEMPAKILNTDKDVTREYSIIRVHSGNADILDCAYNSATGKGSFNTYQFSTYAIAYKDITEEEPAPEPTPVVRYPIVVNGNVTIDKTTAAAGETVNVRTDLGYDIIVTAENGQRIAQITEKGSFTMPASKVYVTAVQNETYALMATAWRNSYVYSYDVDMNKIKVSSTKKRGVIVINLGEEYAGKSFTIYSGRKSTKLKVTEGEFDENGKFVFEVPDGKNYTLVVEE